MRHLIIPDVHGDIERLRLALEANGFTPHGAGYRSDEGVRAIFLGDLIDNGDRNAEVISCVRSMVEDDEATCLMGNHELNAIMLHLGFRDRSEKNLRQHESFLKEFTFGSRETNEAISWFQTLPVRLDFGAVRIAHAFWGDDQILAPLTETRNGVRTTFFDTDLLPDLQAEAPGIASELLDVMKGPEIALPNGGFHDHYGHWRTKGRMKWWATAPETWGDVMASISDRSTLPDGAPPSDVLSRAYGPEEPQLFVGHYKMKGDYAALSPNAVSLDFPEQDISALCDVKTGSFEVRCAQPRGENALEI